MPQRSIFARSVQKTGAYSRGVSLDVGWLQDHGLAIGDDVPADFLAAGEGFDHAGADPHDQLCARLRSVPAFVIYLGDDPDDMPTADFTVTLTGIGASVGCNIPASVRHRADVDTGQVIPENYCRSSGVVGLELGRPDQHPADQGRRVPTSAGD